MASRRKFSDMSMTYTGLILHGRLAQIVGSLSGSTRLGISVSGQNVTCPRMPSVHASPTSFDPGFAMYWTCGLACSQLVSLAR
jgi:hypothetical protein